MFKIYRNLYFFILLYNVAEFMYAGDDHDRLYNHLHPTQWQTLRKLPV